MRLNKFLAHSGVGSRRACDELVFQGRVMVNRVVVHEPGIAINPEEDRVFVDGKRVILKTRYTYIKLNKPAGYITSRKDPHNKQTVMNLIPNVLDVRPVGRLDSDTTGVLLLTDDGDLLFKLTHPRYGIEKKYDVYLKYPPQQGDPEKDLPKGIVLENGDRVTGEAYPQNNKKTHYTVILREGKKREVKRIFSYFETRVAQLHRFEFAGILVDELPPGKWKKLTPQEITHLKTLTTQK
ncbi:MAG: pseudouridine synthase [Candidatus Marinimicrobia bacterium]|nr:pseudouridine synthase [Candidatus Neomarinimicrobiota bacterium]MDD5583168.1 pseudouridine synthase [Candidatus Neomarinimicrobiota bacterium]